MKKLLLLSIVLGFVISLNSCKSESKIVGKWAFTNVEQQVSNPQQATMNKDDIKLMIEKASYTFNGDMTYEMDLVGAKQTGKWYISENGKLLNMEAADNKANRDVATISYLTDATMQLIIQHGVEFTMILTMKKTN